MTAQAGERDEAIWRIAAQCIVITQRGTQYADGSFDIEASRVDFDIRKFLAALSAAGWAVVPVEPTDKMMVAAYNELADMPLPPVVAREMGSYEVREVYRAMLRAAVVGMDNAALRACK